MESSAGYTVVRTFESGRPPWGRWEVRDATGLLVGVVNEERAAGGGGHPSTFAVVHNPTPTPFVLRFSRRLRASGAWWSRGHETVAAAVSSLAAHLSGSGRRSVRHYISGPRR